jgi:hypothetical protein
MVKTMQIESYRECAQYINERFANEEMRNFVFGVCNVGRRDVQGMGAVYKILKTQFILVYLKWLNSDRRQLAQKKSVNLSNVTNVLNGLYKTTKLDLDVIIYVLGEAQKDVKALGENSFFADVINKETYCPYGRIYSKIYDWLNTLQGTDMDMDQMLAMMVDTVAQADGVASAVWNLEDKTFTLGDKQLLSGDVIHVDENGIVYVLEDKTFVADKNLYQYVSLDNSLEATVIK